MNSVPTYTLLKQGNTSTRGALAKAVNTVVETIRSVAIGSPVKLTPEQYEYLQQLKRQGFEPKIAGNEIADQDGNVVRTYPVFMAQNKGGLPGPIPTGINVVFQALNRKQRRHWKAEQRRRARRLARGITKA